MNARQRVDPVEPRLMWDVLSVQDVGRLDATTIDVLERGGCRVDRAPQTARMPEAALLAARDPQCDLNLDGTLAYFSNDGCGVWVIDRARANGGQAPRPTSPTRRASSTPCRR